MNEINVIPIRVDIIRTVRDDAPMLREIIPSSLLTRDRNYMHLRMFMLSVCNRYEGLKCRLYKSN